MLVLQIELLTGVYRAAHDGEAEWPPHPERVFSALVQAWSDGGCEPDERVALGWLERQGPPAVTADGLDAVAKRTAPTVFVPPNDDRGSDLAVLPDRRRRQARHFHAAVPARRLVRLAWRDAQVATADRAALDALAARVVSIGHSASLVRCAFLDADRAPDERPDKSVAWEPSETGTVPLRVPHVGRLDDLVRWHAAAERPRSGASARYRPPGDAAPGVAAGGAVAASVFGGEDQWFVFEDVGTADSIRPDLLGLAIIARQMRNALMSLGPQPVPELLSGHTPAGRPTAEPHAAIVPLANVGWDRATGDLLGLAVVLPRAVDPAERQRVLQALATFARLDREPPVGELCLGRAGVWQLAHAASPSRASLRPERWCGTARTWASATPVLLDRFPEHGDALEEARLVAAACRNIGLPEPEEIEIHKHAAVSGAPSAYPARGDRRRPDWSFPTGSKFSSRPRRHVVLRFGAPVTGPVLLGAGRFHGFGMCLPAEEERDGG